MRERLLTEDVSIISANCNGGIISHDLGLQFRSPTVNLFIPAEDFIRFCENLPHYMSVETMTECTDPAVTKNVDYPVARLDDILLFLVHYSSVEEAQRIIIDATFILYNKVNITIIRGSLLSLLLALISVVVATVVGVTMMCDKR